MTCDHKPTVVAQEKPDGSRLLHCQCKSHWRAHGPTPTQPRALRLPASTGKPKPPTMDWAYDHAAWPRHHPAPYRPPRRFTRPPAGEHVMQKGTRRAVIYIRAGSYWTDQWDTEDFNPQTVEHETREEAEGSAKEYLDGRTV